MQTILLQERGLSVSYKKTCVALLGSYLLLKPFYFLQSGLPQLADMALILLVLISLFAMEKETLTRHSLIGWGAVFFYYTAVVNVVWAILLGGQSEIANNSLFYFYNLAVMIAFVHLAVRMGKKDCMKVIFYAVAGSVLIQTLFIPLLQSGGGRANLLFNNPNQLGYFGLLSLAILMVTAPYLKIKPFFFFLSIMAAVVLVLISLSKAAMLSALLILAIYIATKSDKRAALGKTKIYLMCVAGLLLVLFLFYGNVVEQSTLVQDAVHRLDSIGQSNDDSLAGRGYDRIITHPYYIFLGAGEGLPERFGADIEMHSTLGNILFSYGIVGLALFAGIIFQAVRKLKFVQYYPLLAVLLYGLAHNGIRHTYLWLLLALLFVSKTEEGEKVL